MQNSSKISPAESEYAIETQDLSVYYNEFQAVRDVNLKIESRRITAIIGPSGC